MLRSTAVIASAVGAFVSSQAFAAFTFTFTANPVAVGTFVVPAGGSSPTPAPAAATPLYAVDIYALNDGAADTGTGISALNVSGTSTNPFIWRTNTGGTPNPTYYDGNAGLRIGQDRSYVTLEQTATPADPTFLDERFTVANITPNTTFGNLGTGAQRTGSIGTFSIAGLADPIVRADATLNGGKGLLVGHLVMPAGTGAITVSAAGSAGSASAQTQTVTFGVVTGNPTTNPVIAPVAPTPVVFGATVTNGQTFSVTINVSDLDVPAQTLALAVGSVAGISNVVVTGGGTSPTSFTVTGLVDYSLNKTTVIVPVTATDNGGGSTAGSFSLVVTPEPASLAALAGAAGLGLIRRRK